MSLDNDFLLERTRLYGDVRYDSWLRAYAEFIDATSAFEELTPRTIEEHRADFINLFGEAKLRSEMLLIRIRRPCALHW
jgi:hypothetical protein